MNLSEQFWNAAIDDLKAGYKKNNDHYICLMCGKTIEQGIVYQDEGVFYEAERYMRLHIEQTHESVFEFLNTLDKKFTGLTDHQSKLLKLFYQGKNDTAIQQEMGIKSASTIRNHRFSLKEKELQSKIFLVMMELLKEKQPNSSTFLNPPKTAKMLDDRYKITQQDNEKVLKTFFPEGTNGPLTSFAVKEKYKLIILQEIVKRFSKERSYSEKEVNQILKNVYHDFATIRRYLIEYGFLDRKADGSKYWLRKDSQDKEMLPTDRKHELKQMYKETKIEAGVYQIKNNKNGKVLVESTANLKTINGKRFTLEMGTYPNKQLQKEWIEFGESSFVFETLEILEIPESGYFDTKDALKKLKEKWLNKLQPYGERGYNTPKRSN